MAAIGMEFIKSVEKMTNDRELSEAFRPLIYRFEKTGAIKQQNANEHILRGSVRLGRDQQRNVTLAKAILSVGRTHVEMSVLQPNGSYSRVRLDPKEQKVQIIHSPYNPKDSAAKEAEGHISNFAKSVAVLKLFEAVKDSPFFNKAGTG